MVFQKRSAGVLLPVFSLPSKYGIGTFGKSAYDFVDNLKKAKQSYWQVLPQGHTSYGDSPYQAFSTFAGNPYFIDLELLIQDNLLTQQECDQIYFGDKNDDINYEALYNNRFNLLKKAFEKDESVYTQDYLGFEIKNNFWLNDYALFMAIKDNNNGVSWREWQEGLKNSDENELKATKELLAKEIAFYKYLQYLFFKQWNNLKKYANQNGIEIIGDIPIYVALDSADVWANKELFLLDKNGDPSFVAGCPPDAFSATGQLWGNPLYNWQYHKQTNFEWWIKRIKMSFEMYDVVRVDHFRGFDEYYAIPFEDKTAENGVWQKAPSMLLFDKIKKELGDLKIIAEDLGHITLSVKELLQKTGYPGMKVMQFAFSKGYESDYLLHNHKKDCVVYTGTHDNKTSKSWFEDMEYQEKNYAAQYMGFGNEEWNKKHFLSHTLSSVANLVIVPLQDYIGLSDVARINTPSTIGQNWRWRLQEWQMTEDICNFIAYLTQLYYRD